jgi:hypothetical protein
VARRDSAKRRWRARGNSAIIGKRGMGFIPGMENALLELSRSIELALVDIRFGEAKNVELILEYKRTDKIVLWVQGRFREAANVLESQAK